MKAFSRPDGWMDFLPWNRRMVRSDKRRRYAEHIARIASQMRKNGQQNCQHDAD